MDVTIKKIARTEVQIFEELLHVFEVVFENGNTNLPPTNYLEKLLQQPSFMVFVAIKNHRVIGGLTAYIFDQYYSQKTMVYVRDLAVLNDFQRQGIGTKLMSELVQHCYSEGSDEVFVQAEREDTYALDFYRKTGAAEIDMIYFYYSPKNE